jgi:signal transduction histidine kinase/CheY-like chemotaxis protein
MKIGELAGGRTEADTGVLPDLVGSAFGAPPANIPLTIVPNVIVGMFLVGILHTEVPVTPLAIWFGLLLAFQALIPAGLRRAYRRAVPGSRDAPRWGRLFTAEATANGLIWGSAGLLFFPLESPIHLALLTALLCGMAAGAIPVTAMLLPAFVGAVCAMLLPIMLRSAAQGGLYLVLAGMLLVYLIYTINTGYVHHRLFVGIFRKRAENVSLIRRLTEQTELAEAARIEAERANLAKSRFLAAASHDLRQPLHALSLFSGTLVDTARSQDTRRIADNIRTSVESLGTLLNELLDISRLDAGVVVARTAPLRLDEMFERLRNDFGPIAAEAGLRLQVRPTHATVCTDGVLLEQILRNVLANAVRYTPRGTVFLAARRRGAAWRIEVRDSGIGIAPQEQAHVFEEFYQVANLERDRDKGLGLGLSIVRRLTTLLDLGLDLRSAPERGSTFAITAPAAAAVAAREAPQPGQPGTLAGLRILVIDDDTGSRDAMAAQLDRWGCDILAAESLADADELMDKRQWQPRVVLCDFRLRGTENGVTVLEALRARIAPPPHGVLVTGDTGVRELRQVRESGLPLLHKPVAPAKLRALLQHLVADGSPESAA